MVEDDGVNLSDNINVKIYADHIIELILGMGG